MENVTPIDAARPRVLEFFAGIGLARMGLERVGFRVAWSNDYEPAKKRMYDAHFGSSEQHEYALGDIASVTAQDLPANCALAWASSPCTDLSLAGTRAGLAGTQSGTFWHFVRLLSELGSHRPPAVVLENVVGLATSRGGDDLTAAIKAFNDLGYSVDALAIDARRFVPQSRPRLFLVGAQEPPVQDSNASSELRPAWLDWIYADKNLRTHRASLPAPPPPMSVGLSCLVERLPLADERWWSSERRDAFVASLSPTQLERVLRMKSSPEVQFRTAYRRTRHGQPVWEVRPDDISGCLRTARGGSSKQAIVQLGNDELHVRWMTPLEYARLMGADDYELGSARNNQALFGFGDAVAVPAVSWLAENYLMPLVKGDLGTEPVAAQESAIHG